jgi:hypothetical protein
VKQRLLDEEDAVERMDGWMDGKSTRKTLRTTFLLRVKIFALQRKRVQIRIDDEGRGGTCTGCS